MLLTLDGSLWLIMLRTAIVFVAVLAGLRVFGKRELGQLSTFDLVLLLLIANTVQNAMTGPDTSLDGGLIAATVLLALNFGLSELVSRSRLVEREVVGVPTVLITNGTVNAAALRREDLTNEELRAALREHGVEHERDVALAVLETDGSISVITKSDGAVGTIDDPKMRAKRVRGRQHA